MEFLINTVFNWPLPLTLLACVVLLLSTVYLATAIRWAWVLIPAEIVLTFVYLGSIYGWANLHLIQNRAVVRFLISVLFIGFSGVFIWVGRQAKFNGRIK